MRGGERQRERDAENDRVRTMHPYAGVRDIQRERAQARERREIGVHVVFARQQDKKVKGSGYATRHEQQHREIKDSGHIAIEQKGETGSD